MMKTDKKIKTHTRGIQRRISDLRSLRSVAERTEAKHLSEDRRQKRGESKDRNLRQRKRAFMRAISAICEG
eukprot:4041172-Prorocentrum_lima.AAC.2